MATNWTELNGDDDDDAALRRAIALSLSQDTAITAPGSSDAAPPGTLPSTAESAAPSSMSSLGLDRKKMEEERLARSKKRKAEETSILDATRVDRLADNHTQGPPSQRPKLQPPSLAQPPMPAAGHGLNSEPHSARRLAGAPEASVSGQLPYPKGIVLRTSARGSPRENDITIEEVLQKDDLELAVLSSFQWDEEWLMDKLDLRQTKVMLIAFAGDDTQKEEMRSNVPPGADIRFIFPPMDGVAKAGVMHSKLQLLKYKQYLRIVVPTGNLVSYDWGETGNMENMVFLIDLPLKNDATTKGPTGDLTSFGEELCFFLRAQGMGDKMINSLHKYDFSETACYGFVHTIGGSHTEPDLWQRTGYCGLGRMVTLLGLDTADDVQLDYVCSSVGAVKLDLLTALYNACQGDSGMREYDARTGKPRKSKGNVASDVDQIDLAKMRVYFPSRDTVVRSQGGINSAGTIRFQSKWWKAESFPRQVLRDCKNVRPGVLMHSKVIFVRHESKKALIPTESGTNGWAYIGSHNLSESAWGRLSKDRSGKPKLNARNWECGVVVPANASPARDRVEPARGTRGAPDNLDMFRGSVPVPMELPALSYQGGDGRLPWFADEAEA